MKNVIVNRAKYDIIPDNHRVHKGKPVMCITTGEVFKSATEAADYYGISYNSLIQQIAKRSGTVGGGKGRKGKGIKFCYVSEMGYKADDISRYIIELKAKAETNVEQILHILAEYRRLKEANEEYMKKADEMMKQFIQLVG